MYSVCSAFGLGSLFQLLIFYDLICLYHYTMAGCVISLPGRLDIYYGTPNIGSLPPRHLWIYEIGRHFACFPYFVCHGWLNPAARQTDSLFCPFCLPPQAEPGRHFACFPYFVCHGWLYPADGHLVLPFLSAAVGCNRQTDSLFCSFCLPRMAVPGRRTACFALFVCRGWLFPADGQLVLPFCLPRQALPGRRTDDSALLVCLRA